MVTFSPDIFVDPSSCGSVKKDCNYSDPQDISKLDTNI